MRRTMLFLPSNNPNMLINGGQLGTDSLIFDLEDAVSPDEKDAARELLKNTLESLDFGKCERIVRINGLDTDYWMEDLRAILPLRPETIMPPKVSGAAYIHQLDEALLLGQRIVVMHPDSTLREFDLTALPYPRDLSAPDMQRLKREITAECKKDAAL